jgi:pimeloyl-ACP methyl ester carboxylesterase
MKFTQRLIISYIQTKFKVLSGISVNKTAAEAFRLFCTPYNKSTKQKSAIFSSGEPLEFNMDGYTIRGYRWNHTSPVKVLILHGFSSCIYNFDKYISAFVSKGYGVLAFDAPAHGTSSGKTVNAVQYADTIKQIARLYGPVHNFIGHSFGGIAISLALEQMEQEAPAKIVFIAPATETSSAVDGAFKMLRLNSKKVRLAFDRIIFDISGRETSWFSIRRAIKNIKAEILWIHDEDDEITPIADALKVKEDNLPNIKFVITKGLGHHKIYRDAGTRNLVTNFI